MPSPVFTEKSPFLKRGTTTTEPMTFPEVMNKSLLMFLLTLGALGIGWMIASPALMAIAIFASIGLGIAAALAKQPNPPLFIASNMTYGFAVGTLSGYLENIYPGIVIQAVLATITVLGVTLALYRSGKFRPTPKMTKIFMIAIISYFAFSILNLGLMFFNVTEGMFGLHSDITIFGIPLGIIIGVFAVALGSYSLVLDFDFIESGVENQIDKSYAWTAAYGLVATIVWIYAELLRLIAIIRN